MNRIKIMVALATACCLLAGVAGAQSKTPAKTQLKLTCCEKAFEEGKECRNKCCMAAHRKGKSCEKCNPTKQDLAVMKKMEAKKKQVAAQGKK